MQRLCASCHNDIFLPTPLPPSLSPHPVPASFSRVHPPPLAPSAGQVVVSARVWAEVRSSFEGELLPSGRVHIVSMRRPLQLVSLKRTQFPIYDDTIRRRLGMHRNGWGWWWAGGGESRWSGYCCYWIPNLCLCSRGAPLLLSRALCSDLCAGFRLISLIICLKV